MTSPLGGPKGEILYAREHEAVWFKGKCFVLSVWAGLGSGLASGFAIQYLGQQIRSGAFRDITGIPTSVDSASEAAKAGVPLDEYGDSFKIDLAFNDADFIEEESLAAVIGRQKMLGGESIIQEKTILRAAEKLVLIGTAKQYQGVVDGSIPVLTKSVNWLETAEEIDDLFLGDAESVKEHDLEHDHFDRAKVMCVTIFSAKRDARLMLVLIDRASHDLPEEKKRGLGFDAIDLSANGAEKEDSNCFKGAGRACRADTVDLEMPNGSKE
ncbi:probable ribose-5-phosphate isomerase 4 chloroplastic [Phtheirospermum japonicum]|uniref:ribose-5-phosphate isomerase n=1 Tax=Phtheirospermum japonicum TaxID=374723 RepID=A0A830DFI9_9LAMI|nr:probable ribose-5-phosphate isomerase 4 chloroplastic [Phtheirospermum japonicum]